ncbi:hypothetical protein F5Y03DRAFT_389715 [Xylaria venustula]|nr:hypothetical protein F5Y03DRAFT_389715 [Xylaria venustula]
MASPNSPSLILTPLKLNRVSQRRQRYNLISSPAAQTRVTQTNFTDASQAEQVVDAVACSFIVARAAAQNMTEAGNGGSVILIASISGHSVCYLQPQAAYNTAKAALLMTKNC